MLDELIGTVISAVQSINGILWGSILIYLLTGVGIWFTVRLKAIQLIHFGHMFKVLLGSRKSSGKSISSFQALCTTLAARVGTGNLMGVAVAISLGGAGAIFWMWLIAFVGMATAYAESALAQLYKEKTPDGQFKGGPAYYMKKGLNSNGLALLFSICLFFGYGFVFSSVQANSITAAFNGAYGFDRFTIGLIITIAAGFIVLGGLKNIARFAELVVPFMGVAYLAIALYVVMINVSLIPEVLYHIVASAFGWQEAGSGLVGAAIVQGIKRGLYSNEAGMGSSPNAAAAAEPYPPHPASQGYVQMLGVFIDTIVICSCTAFIILLADLPTGTMAGIEMTQMALSQQVGAWGSDFITVAILFFGFTSIVANYAYADNNLAFVKMDNRLGKLFFRTGFLLMLLFGSVASLPQVIALADMSTGLMTVVNVIALVLLSKVVVSITKDYNNQLKVKQLPKYTVTTAQAKSLNLSENVWPEKP